MRRSTWLRFLMIAAAGSLGADRPGPVGKGASPRPVDKAKAPGGSPPAVQARPKAAATPDPRATSLLRSAQNLEKTGKKPGAIGHYRDVLIRYPESPEAPEAASRIKALGGKIPTQAEIRPAPPAEKAHYTRSPKPRYASQEANRAALNQTLGEMIGNAMSQPAPNGPAVNYPGGGAYSP